MLLPRRRGRLNLTIAELLTQLDRDEIAAVVSFLWATLPGRIVLGQAHPGGGFRWRPTPINRRGRTSVR